MRALAALLIVATLSGCVYTSTDVTTIQTGTPPAEGAPAVDAAALLTDLGTYASQFSQRTSNHEDHEGARVWMMEQMESWGLEVYRQDFTNGIDQANIIGIKWGEVRDQWVVVGGHYDMTHDDCLAGGPCALRQFSQGAYDDGSGTMMTLHLAKAFAQRNTTYTMAFVAYDGEERGTQGAAAFVDAFVTGFKQEDYSTQPYGKIKVVGAVDLDMIGLNWPGVMAPINVIDNSDALWQETRLKGDELGFPESQLLRKDGLQLGSSGYARFWEVTEEHGGPIPTIFFIADFEEVGAPSPAPPGANTPFGAYPFWHFFDTMDTMTAMAGGQANLEAGFQSAVDLAAHLLWRLATDPGFQPDAVPK